MVAGNRTSSKLGREVNSNMLVNCSEEDLGSIADNIDGNARRVV